MDDVVIKTLKCLKNESQYMIFLFSIFSKNNCFNIFKKLMLSCAALFCAVSLSGCAVLDCLQERSYEGSIDYRQLPKETKLGVILLSDDWVLAQSVFQFIKDYEFQLVSLAGVEKGSVLAAAYASENKVTVFEWLSYKAFKKRSKVGFFGKNQQLLSYEKFLTESIFQKSISSLNLKWLCPSFSREQGQWILMEKGSLSQALRHCLGYQKGFSSSFSHLSLLKVIERLKEQGAQSILLVKPAPDERTLLSLKRSAFFNSLALQENIFVLSGFTHALKDWRKRTGWSKKYSEKLHSVFWDHFQLRKQDEEVISD